MQWKSPVDHVPSPAPERAGFMPIPCCWYAAGGGAVGGGPVSYLLYASGGAVGYIASGVNRESFGYASGNAKGRTWFSF